MIFNYHYISYICLIIQFLFPGGNGIKIFHVQDQDVRVTNQVPEKFLGKYKGTKEGYLILNEDGSGEYLYDIRGMSPEGCQSGPIQMEWGFLVDENQEIVRFRRDYGYSYPVLYISKGEIGFQGCRKSYMIDYILERKNGILTVSSSDDWVK